MNFTLTITQAINRDMLHRLATAKFNFKSIILASSSILLKRVSSSILFSQLAKIYTPTSAYFNAAIPIKKTIPDFLHQQGRHEPNYPHLNPI